MSDFSEPSPSDGRQRTGWAELVTGETVELARPIARLGARILDAVILAVVGIVASVAWAAVSIDDIGENLDNAAFGVGEFVVFVVFGVAYEVILTALWGRTLGKRMVGIKVIHAVHGGVPGFGKAAGRWAVPSLPGVVLVLVPALALIAALWSALCYLSLTWDRVYQGWHDKAAGTLVVRT